jgi:hypothetical protein
LEDSIGKEVITQLTANMVTDKVFYTDSNGRDFLKRVSLTHNFPLNFNFKKSFMKNYVVVLL